MDRTYDVGQKFLVESRSITLKVQGVAEYFATWGKWICRTMHLSPVKLIAPQYRGNKGGWVGGLYEPTWTLEWIEHMMPVLVSRWVSFNYIKSARGCGVLCHLGQVDMSDNAFTPTVKLIAPQYRGNKGGWVGGLYEPTWTLEWIEQSARGCGVLCHLGQVDMSDNAFKSKLLAFPAFPGYVLLKKEGEGKRFIMWHFHSCFPLNTASKCPWFGWTNRKTLRNNICDILATSC
jgi:hypothetical protein